MHLIVPRAVRLRIRIALPSTTATTYLLARPAFTLADRARRLPGPGSGSGWLLQTSSRPA
jgi:hypothetical protein